MATEGTTNIWAVEDQEADSNETPTLIFYVQASSLRRNATDFSLESFVRHNTSARMQGQGKGKPSVTKVDAEQVFDILGLLRALQYDVSGFDKAANEGDTLSKNERKYACYRLMQQAMVLGVRLTPPWQHQGDQAVTVPGLDDLVMYIEKLFHDRVTHAKTNLEHGVVDFDSLFEFFRPGVDLLDYGLLSGLQTLAPMMVRCRASNYTRGKSATGKKISNFHAALECVVAVGNSKFAVVESRLFQYEFKGTRRIEDTGSVTGEILYKATKPETNPELAERGKVYQEICSNMDSDGVANGSGKLIHYIAGSFWPVKQTFVAQGASVVAGKGAGRSSRTGGRLLVDTVEAWSRGIHPAKAPADGLAGEAIADAFKCFARINRQKEKTDVSPTENRPDDTDYGLDEDVLLLDGPLPDSLIRRTWPVVCGFSMESRTWGLVLVDGVKPVRFQEQAFEELVLPEARKRLLRALITSHAQDSKGAGVDVLPGKGEGEHMRFSLACCWSTLFFVSVV